MKRRWIKLAVVVAMALTLAGCDQAGASAKRGSGTKSVKDILNSEMASAGEDQGEGQASEVGSQDTATQDGQDTQSQAGTGENSQLQSGTGGDTQSQAGTDEGAQSQAGTGENSQLQSGTGGDTQSQAGTDEDAQSQGTDGQAVDVDLTALSSTMVYSEVYNMMTTPDDYLGKKIKMKGAFSYFKDENTGNEYFTCIIQDATACCAQGIEFVLDGDHKYPDDYPELLTEVTIEGVFDTYMEGQYRYCTLRNAKLIQ